MDFSNLLCRSRRRRRRAVPIRAKLIGGVQEVFASQGGVDGLLEKLRAGGLGEHVNSWVSTGANQPVEPAQLGAALGPDTVNQLSSQTGISIQSPAADARGVPADDHQPPHPERPGAEAGRAGQPARSRRPARRAARRRRARRDPRRESSPRAREPGPRPDRRRATSTDVHRPVTVARRASRCVRAGTIAVMDPRPLPPPPRRIDRMLRTESGRLAEQRLRRRHARTSSRSGSAGTARRS